MKARLGFAVAAHLDPEILLIDEALAGGDAKFKEKTAEKMFELCGDGRTIVIVTHGLSLVRIDGDRRPSGCTRVAIVEGGDPDDVVNAYMRYCRIDARRPRSSMTTDLVARSPIRAARRRDTA